MCLLAEPLHVKLEKHETSYREGEKLFLTCLTQGYPHPKVEWLKNDKGLPYSDRVIINGKYYNLLLLFYSLFKTFISRKYHTVNY